MVSEQDAQRIPTNLALPSTSDHTFASLMLLRGAKPKVISEAPGHSSVAFTMDVYNHIIGGMQEDAMALLDEVLQAGVAE